MVQNAHRAGGRPEMLSRNVAISSFAATMRTSAAHRRGEEPEIESQPWLELRGNLEEPVNGVQDVVISMYPEDKMQVGTTRPAAVGSIIGMKPRIEVVLSWSYQEFDRVWALALSGQLKFGHLYFTAPRRNKGLVVSLSFSSEREE